MKTGSNILAYFRGAEILEDINTLMAHPIFNSKLNSKYRYFTYFMQCPHSIRIEVDRSEENKSKIMFEFDGSRKVTVCSDFRGETYKDFYFSRYNDGSVNAQDTVRSFRSFISSYLSSV